MAGFFGNSMFGHNFQATAFQQNYGNSTGSFSGGKKSHDGMGSSGFGQNGMSSNSQIHDMHSAPGISRQNSILSEMTRSKRDKEGNPWLFAHKPGHVEDGKVLSLYEKPLEVEKEKKRPQLKRQNTFGAEIQEPRRPTFASDPEKMRSKSVSASSVPFQRTVSIVDEPTEPINMDRARPLLRRAQTMAAEKERRKSEAALKGKKPLLPLHLPKFVRRRSSKASSKSASSETNSLASTPPRTRSNTNEGPRSNSSPAGYPGINADSTSSLVSKTSTASNESIPVIEDPEQTKLILSLMNPLADEVDAPDRPQSHEEPLQTVPLTDRSRSHVEPMQTVPIPDRSKSHVKPMQTVPIQDKRKVHYEPMPTVPKSPPAESRKHLSPTAVSKRVHQQSSPDVSQRVHQRSSPDPDNISMHSGHFTPRSVQSIESRPSSACPTPRSPKQTKQYPGKTFLTGQTPMPNEASDSESSETYYDCDTHNGADQTVPNKKNKKKVPKRKRDASTSTCTDGEDTTSTSDTPVITYPEYTTSPYRFSTNYIPKESYPYEAATLPIHRRHVVAPTNGYDGQHVAPHHSQPTRSKPPVRTYIYGLSQNSFENLTINVPNQGVHKRDRKYSSDPKDLHGHDTYTANSSESGYATSHKPLSPRDCDIKVLNFVNSLPNNPDMDEDQSEVSQGDVLNGSETDTDEPNSPVSNLSNTNCMSGSETDADSIRSDDSVSKLEVMKILESPTDVSARVEKALKTAKGPEKPKGPERPKGPSKPKDENTGKTPRRRKNSDSSQTEVLKVYRKDPIDQTDGVSAKSVEIHAKPVEANVVVIAKESSSPLESPVIENHVIKPSYRSFNSFFEKPLLSFRSTNSYLNLSRCTQCVDLILSCLNVVLFLTSAAVIAVALWLLLKNFNVNQMTEILGNNLLQVIIYLSIGGAGTAMLAAFCLCCGIRHDKSGLGFYAFVLILVVFAFATAAVLSAMFADKVGSIEFKVNFRERLITKYGILDEKQNQYFTESWDIMHKEFECCGVEGNENDTYSWAVFKRFSAWYRKQPFKATMYVPQSCCRKNSNTEVCQGSDHNLLGPPVYGPPLDRYYPQKNANLNTVGCYDLFAQHTTVVVAWTALVTGGLAGLYFIVAMLTWFFCFKKSREDNESFMDVSSYDMEVHNDVFELTDKRHLARERPASVEENVTLLATHPVSIHRIPPANPDKRPTPGTDYLDASSRQDSQEHDSVDYADSEQEQEHCEDNMTDDEMEGEEDYGVEQFEPVIDRRNSWLKSEAWAVHLLSMAIEEEDSNFEDSDPEQKKPGSSAFV